MIYSLAYNVDHTVFRHFVAVQVDIGWMISGYIDKTVGQCFVCESNFTSLGFLPYFNIFTFFHLSKSWSSDPDRRGGGGGWGGRV